VIRNRLQLPLLLIAREPENSVGDPGREEFSGIKYNPRGPSTDQTMPPALTAPQASAAREWVRNL
jgi:hypothetical protein